MRSIKFVTLIIIQISILLVAAVCFPQPGRGQALNACNYNIYNGLPSNHIYHSLKDKNGYLWIATDKGVVRYNGYEFKLFNLSNGLPTEDVWELVEDRRGRIWLGSISDEYGYIANNHYHRTFAGGSGNIIYPRFAQLYGDGIIFTSRTIGGDGMNRVCTTIGDTIVIHSFDERLWPLLSDNEQIFGIGHDSVFKSEDCCGTKMSFLSKCDFNLIDVVNNKYYTRVWGSKLFYFDYLRTNCFFSLNLATGKSNKYTIGGGSPSSPIRYIYPDERNGKFHVILPDAIETYRQKPDIFFESRRQIKDIIPDRSITGDKVKLFLDDPFWNTCVGTTGDGLWINYNRTNKFIRTPQPDLAGYTCLGGDYTTSFWWNPGNSSLLKMDGKRISKHNLSVKKISGVIAYDRDTFLVLGASNYFFLRHSDEIKSVPAADYGTDVFSGIKDGSNIFFVTGFGLYQTDLKNAGRRKVLIDHDRYTGLSYDHLRKEYWAYNNYKVFIHRNKGKDTIISKKSLTNFGVKKIEKIVIDSVYGNIFFKGADNITAFNPRNNTYVPLFKNYIHNESSILICRHKLVVAGKFGILFSIIQGMHQVSKPVLYANVKNVNYTTVYDCTVFNDKLLLNTDKGVYNVAIPSDSEIINCRDTSQLPDYRLVLNYKDTTTNFGSGDTLMADQAVRTLQFDIIKPTGNGAVRYTALLPGDSVWHELNANELALGGSLKPDNYYRLSLRINDNVWKSDDIVLVIYIKPYWYQTVYGRRLTWIILSFLVLLLVALTFFITRRYVLKIAAKKSSRMELELKSLYAQMNPHFVFNTLNLALNMIRKERLEDASQHISRFARLLRSYLDSSRNRFITLSEEINNIRNYIEIQQTRFADIFSYEIILDSSIGQPDKYIIPSLLLQPIVENAINHGLVPREEGGHLVVRFGKGQAQDELVCIINDNGIGRKRSRLLNKDSVVKKESHGDSLVNELIAIINKYEQFRIEIHYFDKEDPQTGTIVQLKIRSSQYDKI